MSKIFDTSEGTRTTFEKPNYFYFDYGQHYVRILPKITKKIYTHWIQGKGTLECIGDDECPICENNKRLMAEHPETFRNISGWRARTERHYVNVLDRTPVKVCPNCQFEIKKDVTGGFPPVCKKCETFVTEIPVIISNKVKVANLNKSNADEINGYNESVLDKDGNPLGIENFDFMFLVTRGAGANRKSISVMPEPERNDKVEIPDDALNNLENVSIRLTSDEMMHYLKGISLKDIFSARRTATLDTVESEDLEPETVDDIKSEIDALFNPAEQA